MINQIRPHLGESDGVSWKWSGDSRYSISNIMERWYMSSTPSIPRNIADSIWRACIPPRARLVVWTANLEKLKTGDLLVAWGIIEMQNAMCPFCGLEMETNSHILFSCKFSWSTWMAMLEWWGIVGVLQNRCGDFVLAWQGLITKKKWSKLWLLVMGCVIWSIWFERNKVKFENYDPNLQKFIFMLKVRIGVWAKELMGLRGSSSLDFVHNIAGFLT